LYALFLCLKNGKYAVSLGFFGGEYDIISIYKSLKTRDEIKKIKKYLVEI
jgi:hypothetical protein